MLHSTRAAPDVEAPTLLLAQEQPLAATMALLVTGPVLLFGVLFIPMIFVVLWAFATGTVLLTKKGAALSGYAGA